MLLTALQMYFVVHGKTQRFREEAAGHEKASRFLKKLNARTGVAFWRRPRSIHCSSLFSPAVDQRAMLAIP